MNFILTDLKPLTVDQLMKSLRKQFACSVALFMLLSLPLVDVLFSPSSKMRYDVTVNMLEVFSGMELITWFSFARRWRELKRRIGSGQANFD
jgi:hypothetical protein